MVLEICQELGLPVAKKMTGPALQMPLLGIELDLELRLPPEKLERVKGLVAKWRKRSCSNMNCSHWQEI